MAVIEHLPPTTLNLTKSEQLLFWAGPIQGAPDWQSRASSIISEMHFSHDSYTDLHLANPRREYWTTHLTGISRLNGKRMGLKGLPEMEEYYFG